MKPTEVDQQILVLARAISNPETCLYSRTFDTWRLQVTPLANMQELTARQMAQQRS